MKIASSWGFFLVVLALTSVQCAQDTSHLTAEQEARFQEEGVVRRADNIVFHYTHDYASRRSYGGTRENREDRRASILVTRRSVLIHKNEKVGIQITPRSRRYDVHRREDRVLIHAGTGRTGETWSFVPPDGDAEGWTQAIRAVIQGAPSDSDSTGTSRRGRSRTSRG
jgi:hypothetical protein